MNEMLVVRREDVPAIGMEVRLFNWPLRRARDAKGWTRAELSRQSGVDQRSIGQIERLLKQPTERTAMKLALALEKAPSELFPDVLADVPMVTAASVEIPFVGLGEALLLPDDGDEDEAIRSIDNRETVTRLLSTIAPIERDVIARRFGLHDGEPWTLERIGSELGKTRERIRQIEAKALRKLRHPSRHQGRVEVQVPARKPTKPHREHRAFEAPPSMAPRPVIPFAVVTEDRTDFLLGLLRRQLAEAQRKLAAIEEARAS